MRSTIIALCTFVFSAAAYAAPSTEPADKPVGIGLGVGVATGPNLQLMTSDITHLDVGMGLHYDDRLRLQADHAWRFVNLASRHTVSVPLYLGVGAFATNYNWGTNGGLRMPFGIQADFARAPIQLFGEVAPELAVVEIADGAMDPPRDPLALTGLVGVRAAL